LLVLVLVLLLLVLLALLLLVLVLVLLLLVLLLVLVLLLLLLLAVRVREGRCPDPLHLILRGRKVDAPALPEQPEHCDVVRACSVHGRRVASNVDISLSVDVPHLHLHTNSQRRAGHCTTYAFEQ
jgi:hypothetical protein